MSYSIFFPSTSLVPTNPPILSLASQMHKREPSPYGDILRDVVVVDDKIYVLQRAVYRVLRSQIHNARPAVFALSMYGDGDSLDRG